MAKPPNADAIYCSWLVSASHSGAGDKCGLTDGRPPCSSMLMMLSTRQLFTFPGPQTRREYFSGHEVLVKDISSNLARAAVSCSCRSYLEALLLLQSLTLPCCLMVSPFSSRLWSVQLHRYRKHLSLSDAVSSFFCPQSRITKRG